MDTHETQRHWFDYVVFGIHAVWSVLAIRSLFEQSDIRFWELAIGVLGYLITCFVPFVLYRVKRPFLAVLSELIIIGALYVLVPKTEAVFDFMHIPVLLISYMAWGRHALWALAAVFVYPIVLSEDSLSLPRDVFIDEMVNLGILFGIGYCFQKMVYSYIKMNGMYKVIQEQNQTLEVYAKQIEKLTLSEERNRLSRELHDTVGHTFTTTITGMDAVYYLIDLAPDEAKKSLRELLHVTRNGLNEVRKHIHEIADDHEQHSLLEHLSQIAGQFAAHSGTDIKIDTMGTAYPVSDRVRMTLVRCLQESLTNAKRHGNATAVRIALAYEPHQLGLAISDNGRGDANLTKGFGLTAMTDRLSGVNGSLAITSSPDGGTTVRCAIPMYPSQSA